MREKLIEIFKTTFKLENIDETISQENCEKWDSMNHLNLVVEIEDAFNISIEPEEIGEMIDFKTVERIIIEKTIH